MKKKVCIIFISIISVLCLVFGFSACATVDFKVSFVVDGKTVHSINTNGDEIISMPPDPQKDGYIFDGWYWDKDVWAKPFTANSLLDAPLSSNMNVYCKWRPEHEHAFTEEAVEDKYKASGVSCSEKAKYYYSCACGEISSETFEYGETLPHTEETVIGKASTCSEPGLTDGKKCSVCGEVIVGQATIPVIDHTESVLQSKPASCTEDGLTEGKECSVCHAILVEQEIIPAAHVATGWLTDRNSTCSEKGSKHKECTVCGERIDTEEIALLPHTESVLQGKPAGCTENGLTEGKECSVCHAVLVEQEIIPAAHIATGWITDRSSTCSVKGSKHKECTVCGERIDTEEIALLPHTETTIYGRVPTCTNSGLTNGRICSVCGTTTAEQTVIPATGHKYADGVCVSCGIEQAPATISEVKGGTVNDLDIYMFVEHDVTEVNLLRIVTCSPKSTWKLYEDKRGQHEIATKIASGENDELNNGNNVFYIVATSANGIDVNTYTLTVYRSYAITVKYYNGNALDRTDNVYTGYEYTVDYSPEYRGYTFNCWKDGDETFTNAVLWDNLELNADKTAHTFTVSFETDSKAQAIDGFTVTYDSEVTLPASSKTGYTFNGWLDGNQISANTFVWNFIEDKQYTAKFTVNEYTITYIPNGGTLASTTQKVTYDSEYTLYEMKYRLGYTFEGYTYNGDSFTSGVWNIAENITLNAEWNVFSEMQNFNFTSTATTCTITGIKDKTVADINVPDYVTSIAKGAFSDCSRLTSITIPFVGATKGGTSNTHFGYIFGASSYSYNYSYVPSSLKNVIITGGAIIGSYAFYRCSRLTSIEIPDGVTSIGSYAFYGCSSLTSIEIPDGVTSISSYAFNDCSGLTEITIPDSVTSIGNSAFEGCSALATVNWNATTCTVTGNLNYPIFNNCTSLTMVNIGDNVIMIPTYAFYGCSGLTEITIPDSVTSIGGYAFYVCSGLTSVTIGNGVTSIGEYAFYECSRLTSIEIPDGVTSISSYAFYGCSGLTSVTIGNSVTSIGEYAFVACSGLTSVMFGNTENWERSYFDYRDSRTVTQLLNSTELANPDTAARYLKSMPTYNTSYYWRRVA